MQSEEAKLLCWDNDALQPTPSPVLSGVELATGRPLSGLEASPRRTQPEPAAVAVASLASLLEIGVLGPQPTPARPGTLATRPSDLQLNGLAKR